MSNRIDFYTPPQSGTAIPAMAPSIFIENLLQPFLELIEIVQAGYPEFGSARFRYNEAACPDCTAGSDGYVDEILQMGKRICVQQVVSSSGSGGPLAIDIFNGQIEGIETKVGGEGRCIEITARDVSAKFERLSVYGRRVPKDACSVMLSGMATVFNDEGRANAASEPVEHNARCYTVFSSMAAGAKAWTYAEAIMYLLCEYVPAGAVQIPLIGQLEALGANEIMPELDVTGLSLIEAVGRCCDRIGLEFKFIPRRSTGGPRQTISFYRPGRGRAVELNRQVDYWPVTDRYIVQGDFKRFESTFELVKGWDAGLEDTDYDKFSPITNQNFQEVRDVYRKWCLNEAGDYSGPPYNQGEAYDFSKIFGSDNFSRSRRRFWPTLSADATGTSLGYFLEVSYDSGAHWWQYLYAFDNLLDECGIWLNAEQLDVEVWFAALKGSLKFRITASVIADERISFEVANGPVESAGEVINHLVCLPRQFKYHKVSSGSVLSGASGVACADEVDDSSALQGFARKLANEAGSVIETIDVRSPVVALGYQLGDRVVTSPDSADLLGTRLESRSLYWIDRVHIDFPKQCTKLTILRRRT